MPKKSDYLYLSKSAAFNLRNNFIYALAKKELPLGGAAYLAKLKFSDARVWTNGKPQKIPVSAVSAFCRYLGVSLESMLKQTRVRVANTNDGATWYASDMLIRWRQRMGLSQDTVAEKTGLSRRDVSRVERGVFTENLEENVRLIASLVAPNPSCVQLALYHIYEPYVMRLEDEEWSEVQTHHEVHLQ